MPELKLRADVPRVLLGEIVQRVRYALREVTNVRLPPDCVDRLAYDVASGTDAALAARRLEAMVDDLVTGFNAIPGKTVQSRQTSHRGLGPLGPRLEKAGQLEVLGPGQVALTGTALALRDFFDGLFKKWAVEAGFRPIDYPSLIPIQVLERAEYFSSFPQYLTLASHFPEDVEAIGRSMESYKAHPGRGLEGAAPATHVLSPAVCYHCYPALADRPLAGRGPTRLTAVGQCFRYETVNMRPLERQWNFWMRELIMVGRPATVTAFRDEWMERIWALVERLDLAGTMESAHDPFFTTQSQGKRVLQQLKHLKFELRLALDHQGSTSAVASFNDHEDFFGRTFAVTLGGTRPAHSGCVAFGLERWVNAFLCQHGLDPKRWPVWVAKAIIKAPGKSRSTRGRRP